jgi:hypothetical protein
MFEEINLKNFSINAPVQLLLDLNKFKYQNIFSYQIIEISRQISFHEFKLFKNINPLELLNLETNWINNKSKFQNLIIFNNWHNKFSLHITTLICSEFILDKRIKILENIIDLAIELKSLNNNNALFEIYKGKVLF